MRYAVILVTLLLAVGVHAQLTPKVFASDSRLEAPITMRLKIVSLEDFTGALQKLTKVHFSAAADIGDRKITVIFHDRSAAELMKAVEDAMFIEWKKVGDGYRIILPTNEFREEQKLIDADEDALRSGLLHALQGYSEAYGLSADELDRQEKEINAKYDALRADASPEAQLQKAALRDDRIRLHSIAGNALCHTLSADLPGVVDNLLAGKTICASTLEEDDVPKLPSGFMEHVFADMPDALSAVAIMRLNSEQQRIEGESCFANKSSSMQNMLGDYFLYRHLLHNPPNYRSSKLLARLQNWQKKADPKVLDEPISSTGRTEEKAGYFSGISPGLTLAEHLEYLADHADIPVVGDAFRLYCSGTGFRTESTVRGYIEGLKKTEREHREPLVPYFSTSGGWLLARHQSYWRRLAVEIPESLILPLEAAASIHDYPSVNDYAQFAAGLSTAQGNTFHYDMPNMAFRFDPSPFSTALASLRLWSTLTSDQTSVAESTGLPLTNLTSLQTRIILDGWAEKMWQGQIPAGIWAAVLSPKKLVSVQPVLRFRSFENNSPRSGSTPEATRLDVSQGSHSQAGFEYALGATFAIDDPFFLAKTHG